MYNGNIKYRQNHPQYDSEIYTKSNIFYFPYKYNIKPVNRSNFCISSEEENNNLKANYILTENTRNISNNNINCKITSYRYKILNKFNNNPSSYSNSQINFYEQDYGANSGKSKENKNSKFSRQNNALLTKHAYITLNASPEDRFSNPNNEGNLSFKLFNKQNCDMINVNKKKSNFSTINPFNNSNNGEISRYYNGGCEAYSNYKPLFLKHKSHTLFNYECYNSKNNNKLKNECNCKTKIEKSPFNSRYNEIECYDSKIYSSGNYISLNDESYICNNNLKMNSIKEKHNDELYKKRENKNKESYNKISISKNNFSKNYRIRTYNNSNTKEKKAYKQPINKSTNCRKIENFTINNNIKNFYNENKRSINLVLNSFEKNRENLENITFSKPNGTNKIKKIILSNISAYCDNSAEKKNHSFYEIKSYAKDLLSQKGIKVKLKNSNPIINIVEKKKSEVDAKNNNEKAIKFSKYNNKFKENNILNTEKINIKTRKINFYGLNPHIQKKGNILKQNKINKSINENSEIIQKENNIFKENFNINIDNNSNIFNNNINNIFDQKLKKNSKILLNINKIKLKNLQGFQNIKQFEKNNINNFNKKTLNNKKFNKDLISKLAKKKAKGRRASASELYYNKSKLINFKKINNMFFCYLPNSKENNVNIKKGKKSKKKYSKQNTIQLMNINHKSYEEDFPLKVNRYRIVHEINKVLKPQISFRISLFSTKEQEKEKYFIVNFFYSENLRKKPEGMDSDF